MICLLSFGTEFGDYSYLPLRTHSFHDMVYVIYKTVDEMTAFPKIHYFCILRNIFSVIMSSIHLFAPERVDARIQLPSSKSICNRALILNALSGSEWPIGNLSDCDDTRVMVRAFKEGGSDFDIMAAGTAMRFLTAYLPRVKECGRLPDRNVCVIALSVYW